MRRSIASGAPRLRAASASVISCSCGSGIPMGRKSREPWLPRSSWRLSRGSCASARAASQPRGRKLWASPIKLEEGSAMRQTPATPYTRQYLRTALTLTAAAGALLGCSNSTDSTVTRQERHLFRPDRRGAAGTGRTYVILDRDGKPTGSACRSPKRRSSVFRPPTRSTSFEPPPLAPPPPYKTAAINWAADGPSSDEHLHRPALRRPLLHDHLGRARRDQSGTRSAVRDEDVAGARRRSSFRRATRRT